MLTLIEAVGEMTLLAVKDLARRYCYYSVKLVAPSYFCANIAHKKNSRDFLFSFFAKMC